MMSRNPFRNEADAFRLLVIVGIAAGAVIAVSAIAGSRAGALLGLLLIAVAVFHIWRWVREGISAPPE